MTSEISIRIGQFERVYRLYRTRAPQSYDGFGTLTVYEYGQLDKEIFPLRRDDVESPLFTQSYAKLLDAVDDVTELALRLAALEKSK